MLKMTADERLKRESGARAEHVAEWYLRLNGFLSIPGFIVHIDSRNAEVGSNGSPRHARTEADLLGVRFSHSCEVINNSAMDDDALVLNMYGDAANTRPLFVLVEVTTRDCKMNGPWSNREMKNMERVIRRLGFALNEQQVSEIANAMYSHARWEGQNHILQYICVGKKKSNKLARDYSQLVQIDWSDIGNFLLKRFNSFPEKLPSGHVHKQWPEFGRDYGNWFVHSESQSVTAVDSTDAVKRYITLGHCKESNI